MRTLLIALLCLGCSEGPCEPMYGTCESDLPEDQRDHWNGDNLHATLTLDPDLTFAELDAVIAAAESWEAATEGRVQLELVYGHIPMPERYAVRRATPGQLETSTLAMTGHTVITLSPVGTHPSLQGIVLHELGHFLGLGHEPEKPYSIMYPYVSEDMPSLPTADAVADLRRLYQWH